MKLKFDSNLTYQAEAVQAVVDVFDGQPLSQSGFEVSFTEQVGMIEQTELGLGNRLILDDDQLLANVHEVQTRNEIEPVDELTRKPKWRAYPRRDCYNPDWAIVKHGDETIYMVRETKGTRDLLKMRPDEAYKIKCGQQHFEAIGNNVTYEVVTSAREI